MSKGRVCALAAVLAVSGSLFAQGSGQISGVVHDQSGAVVPGAKIAVTEAGTSVTRATVSEADGSFRFPDLRPTGYILSAEKTGFQMYRQTAIELLANQSLTVDVSMNVGASTQTVEVSGQVMQVDTTSSTLSEVVDPQRIVELPINGRDAARLTTLLAGTNISQTSTEAGKGIPGNFYISANGSANGQVNYSLDGTSNNDIYYNLNQEFPFPDALQEFSVQTSNFSAQYGHNAGAVVNAVTKSGTNDWHGGAFEFVRNREFNARDFFAPVPDYLKRNQFGAYLGGPIRIPKVYNGRNKTFFFAGWQATRLRNVNNAQNALGPTVDELAGNFTTCGTPCNTVLKDPLGGIFPNNQIPVSRMDPASLAFANRLLPGGLTGTGFFTYQQTVQQDTDQGILRIDHQISSADRLTGRFFEDNFRNAPYFDPHDYVSYADGSGSQVYNLSLGEIHIFSPTLLNDFNIGFDRERSKRGPPDGVPNMTDLGVALNSDLTGSCAMISTLSVTGFFSSGANLCGVFIRNQYQMADHLSWIKGKHSFSVGFSYLYGQVNERNDYLIAPDATFDSNITGMAMANFALGAIGNWEQGDGEFKDYRAHYAGVYINDDIKVSRRLTVNLGVRWDPTPPWVEIRDRYEKFSPAAWAAGTVSQTFPLAPPGSFFYGDPQVPRGGVNGSLNNVSPRVGFAWDVFGDGKTSLRGGGGSFYDQNSQGGANSTASDAAPWSPNVQWTDIGYLRAPYATAGIPDPFPSVPPSKASTFPYPYDIETTFVPNGWDTPVVYQWNLTLERQITQNWLARVAYVGSRGMHEGNSIQVNPSVYAPGATTATTNARAMFAPDYGSMTGYTDDGLSRYDSMQATLQHSMSHGVTVMANYTLSRSIDTVFSDVMPWTTSGFENPQFGPSNFDHKNRLVTSFVWDIPSGTLSGFAKRGLGGWELSGIQQYQSGAPLTITSGKDNSLTGLGQDRPIPTGISPNRPAGADPVLEWFNRAAFAQNPTGTFGTLGRGILRGPGVTSFDMGMFKNIPLLKEHIRLQFRAEAFNIFNHPAFYNPATSLTSGTFGRITTTLANPSAGAGGNAVSGDQTNGGPRIIQLALKLTF